MKKLNLAKLTVTELETKEMAHLTGGGNTCSSGRKCGTNYSNGVNLTLTNMREMNPIPQDTIKNDTVPMRYKLDDLKEDDSESHYTTVE